MVNINILQVIIIINIAVKIKINNFNVFHFDEVTIFGIIKLHNCM